MLGTQPATKNNASGLASSRTDIQGVSSYVRHNILQQGTVTSTGNNFDVAINGENAFFVLDNGYGDIYYSRAGEFGTRAENGQLYVVNASGYKLQGFMANGDGTFAGKPVRYYDYLSGADAFGADFRGRNYRQCSGGRRGNQYLRDYHLRAEQRR